MARIKFPGTDKRRSSPEKEKKLNMSASRKKERLAEKQKGSVIRPVLISLRRYREIFGDSDEEEEEFYGFQAEELGLKAYRSFSVKKYLDGSERVSYRKDGARDSHSRYSIGESPKSCQESPQRKSNAKEMESKPSNASPSENIYAKQYRKRESYERKFARPLARVALDKPCLSPNVKSTTQVRANFVPRIPKPAHLVLGKNVKVYERNLFPFATFTKKSNARVPLAKQLLAKAKEGQRIRNQKASVNKDSEQVRSRSGRIVKSKKLDYDDVTSPKFKIKREEARSEPSTSNQRNRGQKRPLEDGDREYPPSKTPRVAEVKLEKMDLPSDQRVYVNNPESPTGFDIQPLSAADMKDSKFRFSDISDGETSTDKNFSLTKKARIKNAKRIKNALNARNHYQQATFPSRGMQRVQKDRTSNSMDELSSLKSNKERKPNDSTEDSPSVKRSERIKIRKTSLELSEIQKHENDVLEDRVSDTSSISEVSSLSSEISKSRTPISANRYVFKSKRLQELQEKMESDMMEDAPALDRDSSGVVEKDAKDRIKEHTDSGSERSSRTSSRRQSQEEDGVSVNSETPLASKKRKISGRKAPASRLQAVKNDDEMPSSSEDEESRRPLSELKKDIKKMDEETTERVVKKVIKVVKKFRTKSGETKTKVVKIIKKMGVKKKAADSCAVVTGRRRVRCGNCRGCRVKNDCGDCRWCKDKPKFGGPGTSKQSCVNRKCLNPQPPKPLGSESAKKTGKAVKPKAVPKKDNNLKEKKVKKEQSQVPSSKKKPAVQVKPPPSGKRQALLDNKSLIKLSWSDNSTEEEIWKEGFAVCFTSGIPSSVKELCFLCGSKGNEKALFGGKTTLIKEKVGRIAVVIFTAEVLTHSQLYYCRVCAEPFHGFCLDETPVDESTWCCDNCSSCSVCGYQDKLLMCDRCQRGYHVECLGPFYPTEPEGENDVWVCGRCVQCKNCGRRTAGDKPEAMWMLEFTHCQECGRQREQNNFCPLCDKCYSDDDFDSKMVHCVECDHWVHAECQGITVDQYECISDLPEDVQFICRQCCSEQETAPWYKELMEEMEAGYERILEEMKSCKAYGQFSSYFEQFQVDNGHPKDLDGILAKVKEWKYISVESFCGEVKGVLDKVSQLVETDHELTKQWCSLYVTFCQELAMMFPFHKIKGNEKSEENQPLLSPNGFLGPMISHETWDHSYVRLDNSKQKTDSFPERQTRSPSAKSPSSAQGANDEVKMEIDDEKSPEKDHSYVRLDDSKEKTDSFPERQNQSPSAKSSSSAQGANDEVNMEIDDEKSPEKDQLVKEEPMTTDSNCNDEQQPCVEEDIRKCLLCGVTGDTESAGAGRLLCCGLDEWVHVNCGLWSAEVFEDDEGRLQNVQVALSRGKQMRCEHCGEIGATVGCCEPRCPMNYHFMCAKNAEAQFQDDKKVYCAQHSFRTKKELLMVDDDFCVERRVCVDMSKIRATKKFSRGFESQSINLVQGSLTLENMGKLSESSDTKQTLYPVNYRTSRLYWSVKDPTKRCRYYCTVEEKKNLKSIPKKTQQENKDIDQQHLHKVISHEEINKKEKPTKIIAPSQGDGKNMAQPRSSNKSNDYLNSSFGKKLKRIAPHPGPSLINHAAFPGVLFKDTNLGAASTGPHLSKLRRILPAPQTLPAQRPSLPSSPANSPRKMLEHLTQQTNHIPVILNSPYAQKSPIAAACTSQKAASTSGQKAEKPTPTSVQKPASTSAPSRNRKTTPGVKRTISFEEGIPQTVRQLNCDHEVVAKTAGAELSNSPVKEKTSDSWLSKGRDGESGAHGEKLSVSFVITSDEGIRIEASTCEAAWKQVFDMVQEARIDRHLKLVPFAGVNGKTMFGVHQESVVSMLEQLPGAHQLKQYSFKYNPPFDISSLEGTAEQVLKENPHGCARAEEFNRTKKYDMFAFLASTHRVAPQLEESTEEQENSEQARDGPLLTVKRPTCLDLPMAMRYRHLKQCSFNKDAVAVYRSPIHGRGLFCTRNIAAGEMVIEYSGMLVRSVLTDKREKYYESKGIGCYMFRVDGTYVVDATMCGNAARFINHSCDSNCYSRVINVDGQKKIIIFASRSISRGEELTYDYKFPIEDEKLPCLCKSKHCRKYLN